MSLESLNRDLVNHLGDSSLHSYPLAASVPDPKILEKKYEIVDSLLEIREIWLSHQILLIAKRPVL